MEPKRDLNFEVNNAKQLNEMLTGVLMDCRRGNIDHNRVKSITLIADKINKNNVNILEYKKLTKHSKDIEFFE
jgi:ppGpp synthetase/RelA/SpoT-type nucleotidyltranferase